MMAQVGGQLETVAPPRRLFGPDYAWLLALLVVSVAIHAWLLTHTAVTARDSLGFARYALCLRHPSLSVNPPDPSRTVVEVIKESEQPPGYPLAILAASYPLRLAVDRPLPETMLLAAQLANALAGVLLVFPTYLIGRMLFGRAVGFASALVIQVLPVMAHVTSDGLSEGVYLLGATTSLMLAVRSLRRPGIAGFLLTGLVVGGTYLVRPEGLLVAISTGLVVVLLALGRQWPWEAVMARLTALGVGLAMIAAPYMLLIGGFTNKPTIQQMLSPGEGPKGLIWKGQPTSQRLVASEELLAVWWNEAEDRGTPRWLWGLVGVTRETLKTGFYVPVLLGVAGLGVLRRRVLADPGMAVLPLLAGLNAAVLVAMAASKGYVSERHTVLIVLILAVFAVGCAGPVIEGLSRLPVVGHFWGRRYAGVGLLLAFTFSALPATLKPLHSHRVGHRHAGEFLARHVQEGDVVIDPFCWAEWYAGRTLYTIPPDPPAVAGQSRWVVLEHITHENPHSRLPRLEAALNVAMDRANPPVVAYQWPEDVPFEEAKVIVYRQTIR